MRFQSFSAGSFPKGQVHPLALEVLRRFGLPSEGFRSKSWDEFTAADAPKMDFVFTVCDAATGETCPVWPGNPITAHWGIPDPAAVGGSAVQRQLAFQNALVSLERCVAAFVALPLESLDRVALQRRTRELGLLPPNVLGGSDGLDR